MIASFRTTDPYMWGSFQGAIITITKIIKTYKSQSDAPWGRPQKEVDFEGYIMYSIEIDVEDYYGGRKFNQPVVKKIIVNDRALSSMFTFKLNNPVDLLEIAKKHNIKIENGVLDRRLSRGSDLD